MNPVPAHDAVALRKLKRFWDPCDVREALPAPTLGETMNVDPDDDLAGAARLAKGFVDRFGFATLQLFPFYEDPDTLASVYDVAEAREDLESALDRGVATPNPAVMRKAALWLLRQYALRNEERFFKEDWDSRRALLGLEPVLLPAFDWNAAL